MISVFDGPNGAGKTTLIAELVARSPKTSVIIHNGPSEDPLKDYTSQLRQALSDDCEGIDTYLDRFNMGEQIYPYIHERMKKIDAVTDELLMQIGVSLGVHWFVLCPPVPRLIANHVARLEEFDPTTLTHERDWFFQIARKHAYAWPKNVHIAAADESIESLIDWVESFRPVV